MSINYTNYTANNNYNGKTNYSSKTNAYGPIPKNTALDTRSLGSGDMDSVFSDVDSIGTMLSSGSLESSNIENNPMGFLDQEAKLKNNKLHTRQIAQSSLDHQFQPQKINPNQTSPVSANNFDDSSSGRAYTQAALELDGMYSSYNQNADMTYGVVPPQDLTHNNMAPYFNKGIGMGYGPDTEEFKRFSAGSQRKVDLYTGSVNDPQYRPKTERRPLFNPIVGLTNIYGAPVKTDFYMDRYIPSKIRRNEYLSQPIKVTPGLNLGYNEVSKDGYNAGLYNIAPRTTDELRTADNPKLSYEAVTIEGQKGVNRGILPNVVRRKPLQYKENNKCDMLKSLGYTRAQAVYGDFDVPDTNRNQTTREYFSAPKHDSTFHKPDYLQAEQGPSSKECFGDPGPRNIQNTALAKPLSNTANTYQIDPTQREMYAETKHIGAAYQLANNAKGQTHTMNTQNFTPDPTKRNLTENTHHILGKNNNEIGQVYAFNTALNTPDVTKRNLTENTAHLLGPNNNEVGKVYTFNQALNTPDATKRNLTENTSHLLGPNNNEVGKVYTFNTALNTPDITKRNLTENTNHILGPNNAEIGRVYTYNTPSNTPSLTKRNITENTKYIAATNQSSIGNVYAFNTASNIPDATKRVLTENTKIISAPNTNFINAPYAFNTAANLPDLTKRNTTQKPLVNQTIIGANGGRTYAFNTAQNIPDVTKRALTEKTKNLQAPHSSANLSSYAFNTNQNIPDATKRVLTENTKILQAPHSSSTLSSYAFNTAQNIPDATKRVLTEKTKILQAPHSSANLSSYAFNTAQNIPDVTKRVLTENTKIISAPHSSANLSSYAFNSSENIPDLTNRSTYNANDKYIQSAYNPNSGGIGGYHANQAGTEAKVTQRQTYENTSHLNPAYNQLTNKSAHDITQQNMEAPTTLRELTENTKIIGGAQSVVDFKPRTREDAKNTIVNISKDALTIIRDGGRPTPVKYDKGLYTNSLVELRDRVGDENNRDLYGENTNHFNKQNIPQQNRGPNVLPQQSWHFDSYPDICLNGNPYVNNTQHKAM